MASHPVSVRSASASVRSARKRWAWRLVAALLVSAPAWAQRAAPHDGTVSGLEPLVVGVVLNAVTVSDGELVYMRAAQNQRGKPDGSGYWVRASSLAAWRLRPDASAERVIDGQTYQPICGAASDAHCTYDASTSVLTITAAPERFDALRIRARRTERAIPDASAATGAYVNYDLLAAFGRNRLGGIYTDAHVFSPYGNGTLRVGVLNTAHRSTLTSRSVEWQWDQPDSATSVTVGSFYGGGSTQRLVVPMVGVRYGSDYALRPDISLVPRPRVSSSVTQPSRADLFVDGLYRRSGAVPYGAFDIEADALLAGLGHLQVVLTDPRGAQTVENLAYYFAPQLLPQGLTDFAVEAGVISPDAARLSIGSVPIASGTLRHGWSDTHTVAATALLSRDNGLVGVMSDYKWGLRGVLRSGLSLVHRSRGRQGDGSLHARALLGHEFQSRTLSTLLRFEVAPGDRAAASVANPQRWFMYRDAQSVLPNERRALTAASSVSINERHQLSASWVDRTTVDGQRNQLLSLSATYRPSNRIQLSIGVQQVRQPVSASFVFVSLVLPLGEQHLGVVSAAQGQGERAAQWSVQSLRDGTSEDEIAQYRVFGEVGRNDSAGASYQRNQSWGQWTVEGESRGSDSHASLRLSGAVGWLPGSAFATRRVDDSVVVVDSDGQPDVPVYFENRPAGRTNAAGRLVVPQARAYQVNRVSIDATALPIDHTVADENLQVVPRRRAATMVQFEISGAGVLLPVRQANGQAVPAGAQADVSTQSRPTAVGSRSEVFINRADRPATLLLRWPEHECRVDYVPSAVLNGEPLLCH